MIENTQTTEPSPKPRQRTASSRGKAQTKETKRVSTKAGNVTPEQRHEMISVAAYFIAEKNGFQSSPEDDWLLAESQMDDFTD